MDLIRRWQEKRYLNKLRKLEKLAVASQPTKTLESEPADEDTHILCINSLKAALKRSLDN